MAINFNNVIDILLGNQQVTQIEDSLGNVLWSATPADEYFYVEDISGSDNTLSIIKESSNIPTTEIFKSTDQTNWESMGNTDTTAITATVPANGKLYLKAVTSRLGSGTYTGTKISCTGNYNVGGYLTSLIFGEDFETNTLTGKSEQTFYNLFKNSVNLISAGKLIMPTTSQRRCYGCMFYGCTALTTAPSLSQTAVGWACFSQMFQNCTSLTTAPALPATTLGIECYSSMFSGCTSLTSAPELPATTMNTSCYQGMFSHTSLTSAPALPATILASNCYDSMFYGCSALTSAPALPATTLAQECYRGMFADCSALTSAPALPATNLINNCYKQMFSGCTSLTSTPELPATTLAANCYQNMFSGCTNLNSVVTYAQDISASGCLLNWLQSVAATGDFYNLGSATYTADSASGIPSGWTEHNTL
jgi:hypothetical protein